MLSGSAVVAIWNGVAAARRDEFYAWHDGEHMPERLAIPGFRCGRRFVATGLDTAPEWFTLYETTSLDVLRGPAYLERLNQPTPWTRAVTADFQNTSRVLAQVVESAVPGMGGVVLTLRFTAPPDATAALAAMVRAASKAPRMTSAHLCMGDPAASGVVTAEPAGHTDLLLPPSAFIMLEACDAAALNGVLPYAALQAYGVSGEMTWGTYRLEFGLVAAE